MNPDPLQNTKLHVSPVRPELVPRPRLVERLDLGLGDKLTQVSAPTSFGKTTVTFNNQRNGRRRVHDRA